MPFNNQPTLVGPRLVLRPLGDGDKQALRLAASDPATWEQHPARERHRPEVFDAYFDFLMRAGGTLATMEGGRIIGCSRYYTVPDQPDDIGIGFTFLAPTHWGGRYNLDMKRLMVDHAFAYFERIWFHIAPDNLRSQVATTRLGATWQYDAELDLGTGPALQKCYRMTPESWAAAISDRSAE
ncbi:MAG: GNAT family N-acetyltransferase [Pseudomonadota bacterium]